MSQNFEVYTQQVQSDDEERITLLSPASPDTFQAAQTLCSDIDNEDANDGAPKKIRTSSTPSTDVTPGPIGHNSEIGVDVATCTHTERCGMHEHEDSGHQYSCWSMPWAKISLTEYDMPRNKVMVKRYLECFEANYNFNLHFVLLAFKDFNQSILQPVTEALPFSLVLMLLGSPKFFTFRCMTKCDMELLRITILQYFGVQKTGDNQLTINLSEFHMKMNPQLKTDLQDSITESKRKVLRKFFNSVELLCDVCKSSTQVSVVSK